MIMFALLYHYRILTYFIKVIYVDMQNWKQPIIPKSRSLGNSGTELFTGPSSHKFSTVIRCKKVFVQQNKVV